MNNARGPSRGRSQRSGAAYLILLIALTTTAGAYLCTRSQVQARQHMRFREAVATTAKTMDLYFTHYLNVLAGVKGLFDASTQVGPDEFQKYLASINLRADHPGLMDLGFCLRVRGGEKEAHRTAMRRLGFDAYEPFFPADNPESFPVVYLEDFKDPGVRSSGWDAFSDEPRRAAMEAARDSGLPAASGRNRLYTVDHRQDRWGFVVYSPLYRGGVTPATLEERRAALTGFVFGSFVSSELWADIFSKGTEPIIDFEVYDSQRIAEETLLYDHDAVRRAGGATVAPRFSEIRSMGGLGRTWTFYFASLPAFERRPQTDVPLLILAGGLLISFALFGLAWTQVRARGEAEAMASNLRQSQAALRASEEKFRGIFESIQDIYFRTDMEARLTVVSPASTALTGYRPEEVRGQPVAAAYVQPEDRDRVLGALMEKGEVRDHEVSLRRKDGQILLASVNARLVRDERGEPMAVEGTLRDITERRQAEAALAAEKERLAVTLSSIGDGVITTDTAGRVVLLNNAAQHLTGWSESEARGQPLASVLPLFDARTGQRLPDPTEQVLQPGQGGAWARAFALLTRDGTRRVAAGSAAPMRDRHGHTIGLVLAFRDITEHERLEAEQLKTSKLESLGLLAGGLAHDFNNILTGIMGNISLALMFSKEEGSLKDRLTEAEKACYRARDLTQQLSTFAKGGAPIKQTAVLTEIIKDSAQFILAGSRCQCEFSLPADLWSAEADKGQISRVIQNLVVNAEQAMPDGGVIHVRADNAPLGADNGLGLPAGRYVRIAIQDAGSGIRPENLTRIFDPYFTTKQRGSGLGLASAYSIVKKHDGLITVQSEPGQGSTFTIYLPASSRTLAPPPEQPTAPLAGHGRILVMDDEAMIRDLVQSLLTRLGYEVELTSDGAEAVQRFSEAHTNGDSFAAVILDLTVPGGMGGEETMKRLLAIDPAVKAIVSSGYSHDPVMAHFREHGFAGVVTKPYQVQELARVLKEVLKPTVA